MRLNVKGLPNECRETAFACRLDLKEIGLDRGDSPWAPEQRRESKHEPAPPATATTVASFRNSDCFGGLPYSTSWSPPSSVSRNGDRPAAVILRVFCRCVLRRE